MKNLLSLLASLSIVSSSGISLFACSNGTINGPGNGDKEEEKEEEEESKQDISTIINELDLGEIIFNSLDGSDFETQNAISDQIRNLNPNVCDAEINILNINRINNFAIISIPGYAGTVVVSFRAITSINLLITYTDLGDIHFYSFTGDDAETRTEIINQIRNLNPNVDNAQINVTNINRDNGTATISAEGFVGELSISFIPSALIDDIETEPIDVPATITEMLQLNDGTILAAGGRDAASSFLATVDLSGPTPQIDILPTADNFAPSNITSMVQLDDGTILAVGGSDRDSSFLISIALNGTSPEIELLTSGFAPSSITSIIQLENRKVLVAGGNTIITSFLLSIDLNGASPHVDILSENNFTFGGVNSMLKLHDGTIIISSGASIANSFLATVDLSGPTPLTSLLILPVNLQSSVPLSMIQLEDGRILFSGGTHPGNTTLVLVDLSGPSPQTELLLSSEDFPSGPVNSMIQLQDGTILLTGGNMADSSDSFLVII